MELKDVILSTLAEIEELTTLSEPINKIEPIIESPAYQHEERKSVSQTVMNTTHAVRDDEARMLDGIRERLLVLFEGFQSPNNVQIEAKVDLTLNFLEYLLATIDSRLDTIKES
ncbi:CiaD-like domain-containing protein [Sulfuricurvum sp.]|uniref:CiaD-like domain-containing protein n=1 Tax=Sulfuricurvum sp. TaxID=2025608 RepID=UPI003BB7A3B1